MCISFSWLSLFPFQIFHKNILKDPYGSNHVQVAGVGTQTPGMKPWAHTAYAALHPHHRWDSGWFNDILTILAGLLSFQPGATCDLFVIATILPTPGQFKCKYVRNRMSSRASYRKQTVSVNMLGFFFTFFHSF